MTKNRAFILTGFITLLFTLLFYHQMVGLNLLLFELILIPLFLWQTGIRKLTANGWLLTAGVALTAIFTLIHASAFVITMNIAALFLWIGWLLLPSGRSFVSFAWLAVENLGRAPVNGLSQILTSMGDHGSIRLRIRQLAYIIVPLFLGCFFLLLYATANPWFEKILIRILEFPEKWITLLLNHINFSLTGVLVLGFATSVLFVFRKREKNIAAWDENTTEYLQRYRLKKRIRPFHFLVLKNEYRAGMFLLIILNLLLLLQNVLDIWFVWIHFEWNGQYLRQFVHEGTFMLILSILISIGIILWLYRGNLNFIPGNRYLRQLSYAWLLQNMILVISVAVRNGWYIYYFALAYKRIGVFIFLALTLIGLITVFIKVLRCKTPFYLLRINALAVFILLMITSLVNWDGVIARYNFSHYQHAFVHLDWLCTLSDKALPSLDKSKEELAQIRQIQDRNFEFDNKYMSPDKYNEIIQQRKKEFVIDFEQRSFLSFNLGDYQAFLSINPAGKK